MFNLWHFNYDVFWSGPLCVHLVWDSLCFLDLHVYILHQLGKISFIIFSNSFPISCSFSSPSGTLMMWMFKCFKLSQRLLKLSSFFWILFSSRCSNWLFLLPYVPNHWFDSQLHPLCCCFPVNCSLFKLVYPSFLTGSFLCLEEPFEVWMDVVSLIP